MGDRSRFDQHLIDTAVRLGRGSVRLREGFAVAGVDEDSRGVTVRSDRGESLRGRYLIAADGAFSPTARALGIKRGPRFALAIDEEVVVDPDVFEAYRDHVVFNFACLPGGYGWVFPKADGVLACGVGSFGGRPALQREMDAYLEGTLPPGSYRRIARRGHPIPIYAERQRLATDRVCLVGDAAGLVDPVLGEGIRFALESGALAAEVVAGLLGVETGRTIARADTTEGCLRYEQLARASIARDLELLYRFVHPLCIQKPDLFYRRLIAADGGWQLAPLVNGLLGGVPNA